MRFSIIIPVFNRPFEVDELLESLTAQSVQNFEVIIVEDGSTNRSDKVVSKYTDKFPLLYLEKQNSGPGQSRNYGTKYANNDYLIFFDSDCIIPPDYMRNVTNSLQSSYADAYGGPDAAMKSFTPIQKAINYSMTSFFTTGGIRGGNKSVDKFHPRSFNLGVSKQAFDIIGGYGKMRFGEDIDFSLRLIKAGFSTVLIQEAFVYHKRRVNFKQFFKQVYNSGIARINLFIAHPHSMKIVHTLPACFVVGTIALLLMSLFYPILLSLIVIYSLLILMDAWIKNKAFNVALLSVAASWVQLFGYGLGFLRAAWKRLILKKGEFKAFEKKFYD